MRESPTEQQPEAPLIGRSIGKYKVVRLLGHGGMGAVYEAVHEDIGQSAAVKVMHPELSREALFSQRFFDEAKAVSKVQHPGLVRIFDFNRLPDGTVYLLMELLKGELLWSRVERFRKRQEGGAFPVDAAARIIRQLASALAAVHGASIIHRDLKPENVFLVVDPDTPAGERAKILDFGIAKDAAAEGRRTANNASLGTPGYMSPEQCAGESKLTDRSDVYSLGVMFYELLAGKPPFVADNAGALMRQHITRTPPPLPEQTPPDVSALVMEMLEKEAGKRPSMKEVLSRLDALQLQGVASTAVHAVAIKSAPGQRRLVLRAAAAVLALIVLGLGLWLALRGRSPQPAPASKVEAAPPEKPEAAPPSRPDTTAPPVERLPVKNSPLPARPAKTAKPVKKIKRGSDLFPDRD